MMLLQDMHMKFFARCVTIEITLGGLEKFCLGTFSLGTCDIIIIYDNSP